LGERLCALELVVRVIAFAVAVTVPDLDEAVSQLGVTIE
jgi:hypothetical protein